MSGLVFGCLDVVVRCLDLYSCVWTCIWVSGLVFGHLDLVFLVSGVVFGGFWMFFRLCTCRMWLWRARSGTWDVGPGTRRARRHAEYLNIEDPEIILGDMLSKPSNILSADRRFWSHTSQYTCFEKTDPGFVPCLCDDAGMVQNLISHTCLCVDNPARGFGGSDFKNM